MNIDGQFSDFGDFPKIRPICQDNAAKSKHKKDNSAATCAPISCAFTSVFMQLKLVGGLERGVEKRG